MTVRDAVRGILGRGGTILGTSRKDPYVHGDGYASVSRTIQANGLDVVVVIGGLGSFRGAVIGSLILGTAESFGAQLLPGLAKFVVWIVMATILLWRPEGLVKDA